jgi:GT2 family glycosyltransferase
MRFCFVSTRRGSYFMTELLYAILTAMAAAGHSVELVFDEFPPLQGECIYVVIPHEFDAWGGPHGFPDAQQRAQTVALCTENPGTEWFDATYRLVREFAAAVSINRSSAAELQRLGVRCEHLQLGYSPLWDSWLGDESLPRDIDVLYLGAADPRRDPLLGGLGKDLWARQCQFLIPPLEPRTRPRPDFLRGMQKYNRLRSAQIMLNLHRTTSSALEWMRFLEAISNGCVVVSEPCLDSHPLVPGEHFIEASVDRIGLVADRLLETPDQLHLVRARAYSFVRQELSMASAANRLAQLAAELLGGAPAVRDVSFPDGGTTLALPGVWSQAEIPSGTPPRPRNAPATTEAQPSRANLDGPSFKTRGSKDTLWSTATRMLRHRLGGMEILDQTAAYALSTPRITVVLVVGDDREHEAVEALASAAVSAYSEFEVLILDDTSSKRSMSAMRCFLDSHPLLPARLLCQRRSHGLGHARNMLAEHARGRYLFILEATGGIYPSTLQRLLTPLEEDPQATFSYSMVAVFEGDQPKELLGSLPWEPERLKSGNWIDAMALIRRTRLLELGGYSTDPRLDGWEDFDLWCRCAQAGGHGVHVAQVLAWHRRTVSSATATDENATPVRWALMRERFPQLLTPASVG